MELTGEHIKAIAGVLGETQNGFTKSELTQLLSGVSIAIQDDGSNQGQFGYQPGLNKREWLNNCLVKDVIDTKSSAKIITFIQSCMNPVNFTQQSARSKYEWMFTELSKVLLLMGIELGKDGKLRPTSQAKTLDDVDIRINSLQHELYVRKIHPSVTKYCTKELLAEDYYHAVHEAAKGIAERIREMTGLTLDGTNLFNTVFSHTTPYITVGKLGDQSELNEQNGIKELCDSIFQLVRNTTAHRVRLNWDIEETMALDMLSIMSTAHKYLDNCIVINRYNL